MNFHGGRSMRAFKPSQDVLIESREEDVDKIRRKQLNIERYAQRVRDGLPLFDDEPLPPQTT